MYACLFSSELFRGSLIARTSLTAFTCSNLIVTLDKCVRLKNEGNRISIEPSSTPFSVSFLPFCPGFLFLYILF